jgi:ribose/xylose/arabinose/galactoside ABC-type transport system permease subunit
MTRSLLSRLGPFLGLALVLVVFGILVGPQFFRPSNLELMARQATIVAMAALGMTLVIAAAGIDLSVGSIVALSTVVVARLLRADFGPAVAALGGVAAGAVIGAAKGLAQEQRLEAPSTWLNSLLKSMAPGEGVLPWGVTLLFLLAVVVWGLLQYTRFGRHLLAIGSNERTARLCGVPVERCLVAVYAISAALAGLAGVLQFSKLSVGDPVVAIGLELDVIAAVIIGGGSLSGGKGSVAGTLAGAALMVVISVGCTHLGMPNWVQQILTGLIIVVAVALDRLRERTAA